MESNADQPEAPEAKPGPNPDAKPEDKAKPKEGV